MNVPPYKKIDFNTVWIEPEGVRTGDTYLGRAYAYLSGRPRVLGNTHQLESLFKALYEEAKGLGEGVENATLREHKIQILKEFDALRQIFLMAFGASLDHLTLLRTERERLKETLHLVESLPEKPAHLPSDLIQNLNLQSVENMTIPLSPQEMQFVEGYLSTDPIQVKLRSHYEAIRQRTENLEELLTPYRGALKIGPRRYPVYDLTLPHLAPATYQFIGSSGHFADLLEHYQGYQKEQWPYICASLIDSTHPYFHEKLGDVFQIFSVPANAITHTSHRDLMTPPSSATEQPGWYALSQRLQVISAYINHLYEIGDRLHAIPLSTPIDKELRLMRMAEELSYSFSPLTKPHAPHSALFKRADLMLLDQKERKDSQAVLAVIEAVKETGALEAKDFEYFSSILTELVHLESQHPHFYTSTFDLYDMEINRMRLQLDALRDYYHQKVLTPEERKTHYLCLFAKEDPTQKYDINAELEALSALVQRLPIVVGEYASHLNRLLGPHEILSETEAGEHNEINLIMNKGVTVQAWLFSKGYIYSLEGEEAAKFEEMLKFAQKNNIPVLIR